MKRQRAKQRRFRVRLYELVADAVTCAIGRGMNSAHKHVEKPSREHVEECIDREVMSALTEIIDFEDVR